MEIKYIGFYDLHDSISRRVSALSAMNKMDYICDVINRMGYDVHLVSPSWYASLSKKFIYEKQQTVYLKPHKKLTVCPCMGGRTKLTRNIQIILSLIWLFLWLITHVKYGEKVLMYHTPWLYIPVRLAQKILGFHLILEFEELYADVNPINKFFEKMEYRLISSADSYLLSTEMLLDRIDSRRQHLVIYGNYNVPRRLAFPQADGKIHVLYAGIIDEHKNGAFNAVECARYLDKDYVMHIIGFGDTEKLCRRISELKSNHGCRIVFDGIKTGDEYIGYLQSCHIGLSTQRMEGKYLETSFPSKILSYLSMGLQVVSCSVNCVRDSKIGDTVYYYYNDSPEEIAKAISSIKPEESPDSIAVIKHLDDSFMRELKGLLDYGDRSSFQESLSYSPSVYQQ